MLRDLVRLQKYFKDRCPTEWPSITFDEQDEIQLKKLFVSAEADNFTQTGNTHLMVIIM